jgi:AcrR family transcriptional regulator
MATTVPVTGRGVGTRRCILDEAALAFARSGYAGTSLNDVIAATGLTKGAFYFHFPSKEALAIEVFRSKQQEWAAKAVEAAGREERALDKLLAMTRATCDVHETDPAARVVPRLCWDLGEDPTLAPQMTPFLTNWFDIVEDVLRSAQREGDVRTDIDVRSVAEVAVASFIGINDVSHLLNANMDLREKAEQLMDLILQAIATEQATKRLRASRN